MTNKRNLLVLAAVVICSIAAGPAESAKRGPQKFPTAQAAADAFVAAAEAFDVAALTAILGADGIDLVATEDEVQDRNHATAWAAMAREKLVVATDPANPDMATLNVGPDEWPTPIPLVRKAGGWRFDIAKGRDEIFLRRVGDNELHAIGVCRSYVEAQHAYASAKRDGARVNQYAQRIISTPGRQDGLAWRNADGTPGGPLGEEIAGALAAGYSDKTEPYRGYYFKVLKGQGPSAPLGSMDFVVQGAMIGGFALVAAPADYEKTGVKTFIVGYDGVVYEKDLGPETLDAFQAMELYDPDDSWSPVEQP